MHIYNVSIVKNFCVLRKKTNATCNFIDFEIRIHMPQDYEIILLTD